ncbi:hypothetical protein SAMN05444065_1261 [Pseudomonas syringae]|uniref:Uncharacterized protein n=1 Tax=Pseudomonas syringae TaxID=317 RepID=A0AB38C0I7_PSESX|nr:hypothetical protein SAMN05444065_1261 [Pseudomonas syringae]SFO92756.1 urea carboxylase [Pseudomonas syringae]
MAIRLVREDGIPDAGNPSTAPDSSRASSLPQGTACSCRSELVREGGIPDAGNPSTVAASSRASSLPQGTACSRRNLFAKAIFLTQKSHRLYRPLREQARSHKVPRAPVGANLFAKAIFLTQEIHRLQCPLREQARSHKVPRAPVGATGVAIRLVREGGIPDAGNPSTATNSSRASSLPQGTECSCRNLLAKAVFLTQEIHRLQQTLREQARSHKVPRTPVGDSMVLGKPSSHFCLIFALVL